MAATPMAEATVDDLEFSLCESCDAEFAIRDGWEGRCPECGAVGDDHDAGWHDVDPVDGCLGCDVVDDRLDLFAIA